jgi:hypothetical protein
MVRGKYRKSLRVGENTQHVYPCYVLLREKREIRSLQKAKNSMQYYPSGFFE